MPSFTVFHRLVPPPRAFVLPLVMIFGCWTAGSALAYGPRGFDTVVIDAGHGGYDRGGGPGQAIPEKPYTLDTAYRLQRALRARGFRTVMTRTDDVFVSLPERVAIADQYRDAIFISIHYNSAPRAEAHGYETYYYRSDSAGLAARLHRAQLSTLNTDDRHVRRRGFYVVRRPYIPAVLCEGGFLTNPEESRIVLDPSYRQHWANNIADAIAAQRREGDPYYAASMPVVTTYERPVVPESEVRYYSRGGGGGRRHGRGYTRSHGSSRSRRSARSHGSSRSRRSTRSHGSSHSRGHSGTTHRRHRTRN